MDHWKGKECLLFQQFFFKEIWEFRNYVWQEKLRLLSLINLQCVRIENESLQLLGEIPIQGGFLQYPFQSK